MTRPLRVVVADDHPSVRENLRGLIDDEPDLECVGVGRDGLEALALCRALWPDVLVIDDDMPRLDGLTVAARIGRDLPRVRVVVYTLNGGSCALAATVRALCVTKDSPHDLLLDAVRGASARAATPPPA